MNAADVTLNRKINDYLNLLNTRQKKALLTVAKTFAEEQATDYSDEFKAELDSRYDEYKNGGNLVDEAVVNKRINTLIQRKPKK